MNVIIKNSKITEREKVILDNKGKNDITIETKKIWQLDRNQKFYLGNTKYTYGGMDGSYARAFDKGGELTLMGHQTIVEVRSPNENHL